MVEHEIVTVVAGFCALVGVSLGLVAIRMTRQRRRARLVPAWNAAGTHDGVMTRKAQAAIPAKHLLGKIGANGEAYVAVTGPNDIPLYVMPDEAEAEGDAIACEILGALGRTVRMVTSDAIDIGVLLVPATNGKVKPLPTTAGTYQVVGRTLSSTDGDGELIEVASCVARAVTIS